MESKTDESNLSKCKPLSALPLTLVVQNQVLLKSLLTSGRENLEITDYANNC